MWLEPTALKSIQLDIRLRNRSAGAGDSGPECAGLRCVTVAMSAKAPATASVAEFMAALRQSSGRRWGCDAFGTTVAGPDAPSPLPTLISLLRTLYKFSAFLHLRCVGVSHFVFFKLQRVTHYELCIQINAAHSNTSTGTYMYEGGLKSFRPQHEDSSTRK